jgi:hypothetical protein
VTNFLIGCGFGVILGVFLALGYAIWANGALEAENSRLRRELRMCRAGWVPRMTGNYNPPAPQPDGGKP